MIEVFNKGSLLENKGSLLVNKEGLLEDKAGVRCEGEHSQNIHKTFTKHSQNEGKTEM